MQGGGQTHNSVMRGGGGPIKKFKMVEGGSEKSSPFHILLNGIALT